MYIWPMWCISGHILANVVSVTGPRYECVFIRRFSMSVAVDAIELPVGPQGSRKRPLAMISLDEIEERQSQEEEARRLHLEGLRQRCEDLEGRIAQLHEDLADLGLQEIQHRDAAEAMDTLIANAASVMARLPR